jgi:hypothetical protein
MTVVFNDEADTMNRRIPCTVACALAFNADALAPLLAQPNSLRQNLAAIDAPQFETAPTTVLVMAPNGSWGAATDDSIGVATAAAVAHCKRMYRRAVGCGAYFTAIRGGWSLGIRCGDQIIMSAERTLIEAEQAAIDRELELRRFYRPDLPPCIRLVSIEPSGAVVAPYVAELVRVTTDQRSGASR